MKATEFLLLQTIATVILVAWKRKLLVENFRGMARALVFNIAAVFLFDYLANDRGIWTLPPSWQHFLLRNPIENTVFTILMTVHLVLILAILEERTASSSR